MAREGQLLLPMADLITQAECAVDELIDVMGRATIEAALLMSAAQVAGPRRQSGPGQCGEVEVPAYEAMRRNRQLGERMLAILLSGVSMRRYEKALPEMAETAGVSKSPVIRESIEDAQGYKHVLGLRQEATENAVEVKELLEELVARGVAPGRRLFVIDGSKALRRCPATTNLIESANSGARRHTRG